MKRALLFGRWRDPALILAGTCLIAGTYGLVRLAYGLFLPGIQDSMSMGDAAAGYVSTGASVSYCGAALLGAVGAGRPRVLVLGAASTAAVGSAAMALAPSPAVLVPATVLASAGAGLASPGLVATLARNLPAAAQARAQATVNAGTGPGLVAAGALALLLPQWRTGFAVAATVTCVAGACVLLLDRGGAPDGVDADRAVENAPRGSSPRWLGSLVVPAGAAWLLGAASAAVWTYGRAHLVAAGSSDTASVVAWIAVGVGGTAAVAAAALMGRLAAARAWLFTTSAVAVAIGALAIAPSRYAVATLACAVFGWGFVAASSALIAWTAELPRDHAAAGTSVLFVALVLGQASGSAAIGAVSGQVGLSTAFLGAAVVAVGAAGCGVVPPARVRAACGGGRRLGRGRGPTPTGRSRRSPDARRTRAPGN